MAALIIGAATVTAWKNIGMRWMMALIRNDDGTIRRCDRNIKELGYWKSLSWFGYKYCLDCIDVEEVLISIKLLAVTTFYIVLFPILPLIACYVNWRRAVRRCEIEDSEKMAHIEVE